MKARWRKSSLVDKQAATYPDRFERAVTSMALGLSDQEIREASNRFLEC